MLISNFALFELLGSPCSSHKFARFAGTHALERPPICMIGSKNIDGTFVSGNNAICRFLTDLPVKLAPSFFTALGSGFGKLNV